MGDEPSSREAAGNSREGQNSVPFCRYILNKGYCGNGQCRFVHPRPCQYGENCGKEKCKKRHFVKKCVEWRNCENPECRFRHSADRWARISLTAGHDTQVTPREAFSSTDGQSQNSADFNRFSYTPTTENDQFFISSKVFTPSNSQADSRSSGRENETRNGPQRTTTASDDPVGSVENPGHSKNPTGSSKYSSHSKNPAGSRCPVDPKNPRSTKKNPTTSKTRADPRNPAAPMNSTTPKDLGIAPKNPVGDPKNPEVPIDPATSRNPAALRNLGPDKSPDAFRNPDAPKNPAASKNPVGFPMNPAAFRNPTASENPATPKNPAASKNRTAPKNPTASEDLATPDKSHAASKNRTGSKNRAPDKNPATASENSAPKDPGTSTREPVRAKNPPSLNQQWQEALDKCDQDVIQLKEEISKLNATVNDTNRNMVNEHVAALESKIEELETLRQISVLAVANAEKRPDEQRRAQFRREIFRLKNRLPAFAKRIEFENAVRLSQFVVVRGETGSGKSTQLTQFLVDMAEFYGKKVICTQPRKIAAISLAQRVAYEFAGGYEGVRVGGYVGYRVGSARRISKKTCIEYMTESMLLKIINKPEENDKDELEDCCAVIVDEAHVRSINTDVLMGILKRDVHRWPHLKVIVTSATINTRLFSEYFHNCPVVEIPGRLFPVEVAYKPCEGDIVDAVVKEAVDLCKKQDSEGHILCFLTGQKEVETAAELAKASLLNMKNIQIHCLYGKQLAEEQQRVFQRMDSGSRKVIFATDVAETSLTIDGVRIVIDSGMTKNKVFDSRRNVTTLKEMIISKTSAIQRKGRAGRTSPGICYRLYTEEDYEEMLEADLAEVFGRPLAITVAMLKAMNVDPLTFNWIERPEEATLAAAQRELTLYGALDRQGNLTELGSLIAELQIDPGIAKMIFYACARGLGKTAVQLAGLFPVSSMVFWRGGDMTSRKAADKKKEEMLSDKGDIVSIYHVYQQWMGIKKQQTTMRGNINSAKEVGKALTAGQWCMENYVNNKSLEMASSFYRELIGQLKEMPMWNWSMTQDKKANDEEIQRLVLQALLLNVACLVNRTYVCILSDVAAYVHPGSVLFQQELSAMPKLIVFQTILRTSRVYASQLTPVSWEWLERDNWSLHADYREKALELHIAELRFDNVSRSVLQNIVGRYNKRLDTINAELGCSINADFSGESLVAWCKPRDEETVRSKLTTKIEKIRKRSRLAVQEEILLGRTRLVWGSGGVALALLFGKDYVSFNVRNVPEEWDVEDVVAMVTEELDEEDIRSCDSFARRRDEDTTCWKITIKNPEKAEQICKALDSFELNGNKLEVSPASVYTPAEFRETCGFLRISFATAPSNGTAILMYNTAQDANRVLDVKPYPLSFVMPSKGQKYSNPPLDQNGRFLDIPPKKNQKFVLYVNRLPKYLDEDGILQTLERADLPAPSYICVARKKGVQPQGNPPPPEEIVNSKNLAPFVEKIVNRVPFVEAKRSRAGMKIFYDSVEEVQLGRLMTSHVMIHDQPVVYETGFNASVMVQKDLYELRKEEFENAAQYARSIGLSIHINPKKSDKRVAINIQAPSVEELEGVRKTCSEILSFSVLKNPKHRLFFTQYGRKILEKGMKENPLKDAFIHRDFSLGTISVYGTREQQEEALNKLNALLNQIENLAIDEQILIRRASIQQVKDSLKNYKEMFPELQELRVTGNRLFVTGTTQASRDLRELFEGLQFTVQPKAVDKGDCGICFDTLQNHITLEICNHKFCMDCIAPMLELLDLTLPIKCPFENCGTPLGVKDIQQMASPVALERIKQLAVLKLIKERPLVYAECFERGCPQYLPISDRIKSKTPLEEVRRGGSVVACDQCATWYCVTCSRALESPVTRHRGLDCAQRQLDDEKQGQRDVRFHRLYIAEKICTLHCPRCSAAFDSFTGCCVLSCSCGIVFCFFCLGICAGDGHAHVIYCPKNPSPGQLYLQPHVRPADVHKMSRKSQIVRYLMDKCADDNLRREVLKAIQVDITDLDIRITPGEVGLLEEPDPEEVGRHRTYIIEEILTLKCPRCRMAFHDFDGCCALTCRSCSAGFCYCCLEDCGRDAHEHVRSCSANPFKSAFIPAGHLGPVRANRYKKLIINYLSTSCSNHDMIAAVLQAADRDLRDVDVHINARDITITPGNHYRPDPAGSQAAGLQNYQLPNLVRLRPVLAMGPNALPAPARPPNNPLPNPIRDRLVPDPLPNAGGRPAGMAGNERNRANEPPRCSIL